MPGYSLRHLENHVLLRDLAALVAQDRTTTATLLAHLAEADWRKLYARAGYPSMFHYCIHVFGFSEDMAGTRILASRIARRYPAVFEALAEGRLHVSGLCLISKPLRRMRSKDAVELLAAIEGKTKREIRLLLAERFPQPDLAARVTALPPAAERSVLSPHVPERVEVQESSSAAGAGRQEAMVGASAYREPVVETPVVTASPPPEKFARIAPRSPGRHGVQFTISDSIHEKLERAKKLLSRAIDPNDLEALFDRALDALIEKTERRRFAATDKPRRSRGTRSARTIPADVKRKVRERDGDQCAFVSDDGRRCEERTGLEIDHIIPVARGGESTVENLRLLCSAHNQYEAERMFGAEFMQEKRERALAARGMP